MYLIHIPKNKGNGHHTNQAHNAYKLKGLKMSEYMECPTCGEEFQVADELLGTSIRCPRCYQGINPFGGLLVSSQSSSYDDDYSSGYANDIYEENGWEAGYDY